MWWTHRVVFNIILWLSSINSLYSGLKLRGIFPQQAAFSPIFKSVSNFGVRLSFGSYFRNSVLRSHKNSNNEIKVKKKAKPIGRVETTQGAGSNARKGRWQQKLSNEQSKANTDTYLANDPSSGSSRMIPPEVVFFGEPRNPPPASLADNVKYHGSLLYWARHATVAPKNSVQRLDRVFPKGRQCAVAEKYRLVAPAARVGDPAWSSAGLSYEAILSAFLAVADDLEASKAFVDSNMDIVPSKLFLRALTAHKLALQSRGDVAGMHYLKQVRDKYILAHDQLFFPLNIELQKAETRVMTYLGRSELYAFAQDWDAVEMSLHFATLLSARLIWDQRVQELLQDINRHVDRTVGYMAGHLRRDLLDREFRAPAVTADLYRNASDTLQGQMPGLYGRVLPELRLLHETYSMTPEETVRYVREEFCPREGLTVESLKERLRLVDATVAAIQGTDYILLRLRVQDLFRLLCSEDELQRCVDHWYFEFTDNPEYDFETYEPDEVPLLLEYEQRLRDTGNAFLNFAVEVLQVPTQYTEALAGRRRKAKQVGDWLQLDPDQAVPGPQSNEECVDRFRDAYIEQTRLRKEAEARLNLNLNAGHGKGAEGDGDVMSAQDHMLSMPAWAYSEKEGGEESLSEFIGRDNVQSIHHENETNS